MLISQTVCTHMASCMANVPSYKCGGGGGGGVCVCVCVCVLVCECVRVYMSVCLL